MAEMDRGAWQNRKTRLGLQEDFYLEKVERERERKKKEKEGKNKKEERERLLTIEKISNSYPGR